MKNLIASFTFFIAMMPILQAQATTEAEKTRAFIKGVFVEDGCIKVKGGYSIVLSNNNKMATIRSKKNIAFVFTCNCTNATSGDCLIIQNNNSMQCSGTCGCKLTTIINSVKYEVDFINRVLKECL